jgi:hypothetical protein
LAVWNNVDRAGLNLKKKSLHPSEPDQPNVVSAHRRLQWRNRSAKSIPTPGFIDETGVKTKIGTTTRIGLP